MRGSGWLDFKRDGVTFRLHCSFSLFVRSGSSHSTPSPWRSLIQHERGKMTGTHPCTGPSVREFAQGRTTPRSPIEPCPQVTWEARRRHWSFFPEESNMLHYILIRGGNSVSKFAVSHRNKLFLHEDICPAILLSFGFCWAWCKCRESSDGFSFTIVSTSHTDRLGNLQGKQRRPSCTRTWSSPCATSERRAESRVTPSEGSRTESVTGNPLRGLSLIEWRRRDLYRRQGSICPSSL